MKRKVARKRCSSLLLQCVCVVTCGATLATGGGVLPTRGAELSPAFTQDAAAQDVAKGSPEQLASLGPPTPLYPAPLLRQTLVPSTCPLEIVQLQQWLEKNPGLTGKKQSDAVAKQPGGPRIQARGGPPRVRR